MKNNNQVKADIFKAEKSQPAKRLTILEVIAFLESRGLFISIMLCMLFWAGVFMLLTKV